MDLSVESPPGLLCILLNFGNPSIIISRWVPVACTNFENAAHSLENKGKRGVAVALGASSEITSSAARLHGAPLGPGLGTQ